MLGKPCNIYLPENPNIEKKRKIEALGAKTTILGRDLNIAKGAAQVFARETGGLFVDDGEDVTVMEGAGTIGIEVGSALEHVDYLVVPMGGGNLIAGCAAAIKIQRHPQCEVVAIQSSDAPSMHESFLAGRPIEKDVHTVAECLAQRVPADLALQGMLKFVDRSFVVPDADLFSAAHTLALYGHLLAEPGSAAAIACLARFGSHFLQGRHRRSRGHWRQSGSSDPEWRAVRQAVHRIGLNSLIKHRRGNSGPCRMPGPLDWRP
ncbi:pyridoxal-phosphate dependent enzyme (plasmid) [Rhizobium sp. RCAM05350]|uniref:pyridoxal-phosphate dependent enzyme n=1 Tax=Rhizobium sp. RCAM05350 TaxID=2895568 RepID=UPI00207676E8|nr:pyridoxal-phosphate dependent enzyme [Rhizobium sp. RCAM05350]URK89429.1 pyridoxal-phosphate dependent enzyme [Rhizobium sp. RCAM05350]